jgi:hypothetical protein
MYEAHVIAERASVSLTPAEYRRYLAASTTKRARRFNLPREWVVTHGGQRVTLKVYDKTSAMAVCQHLVAVTGKRHDVTHV